MGATSSTTGGSEPDKRPSTLAEWASWYAANGFAVFPLKPRTKEPSTAHGHKDATTDAVQVARWWGMWPNANIGIATGAPSGGLLVIDLDVDEDRDEDGRRTLSEWEHSHAELPETLSVVTGRGGQHLWYRTDEPITCSQDDTEDKSVGVDIRANGGYVVAPPSAHPNGRSYEFEDWPWDSPITEASLLVRGFVEHVRKLVAARKGEFKGADAKKTNGSKPDGSVAFKAPDKLKEGARDRTLFRYACSERARNIPYDVVLASVREYNRRHCEPPLDDATVVKKVNSAFRYQAGMTEFKSYMVNDRELAALFAGKTDDIRYVTELKQFTVFNGRFWQIEGGNQLVARRVKEFVFALEKTVAKAMFEVSDDTPDRKKDLSATYKKLCAYDSHNKRTHLVQDVASESGITCGMSDFDRKRHLLNVENGTLDLNGTPVFKPHDPADMITRMAPVAYDPDAECPLFLETVATALEGDIELIRFLQKWFGCIVAGVTELDKFLLVGLSNRASKDTVWGTLLALLGWENDRSGYGCIVSPESLATRTFNNGHGPSSDVASWQGKRLLLTTEFSESVMLDVELLKRISGGTTPIKARRMRENDVTFRLDGILVMLCNLWPDVRDKTLFDGNRPMCLPFEHKLEEWEIDVTLRERLRSPSELSGILNWSLEGLKAYRAEGLEPVPDSVRDMNARFRMESDAATRIVGEFVSKHLVPDADSYTTVGDVYEAYKATCSTGTVMGPRDFSDRISAFVTVHPRVTMPDGSKPRRVVLEHRLTE